MKEKSTFIWQSFGLTHIGNVRQLNEDAFIAQDGQRMWAVADGMGGHRSGDMASKTIIHHLESYLETPFLGKNVSRAQERIYAANQTLLNNAQAIDDIIGSTIVVLLASQQYSAVIWAGDSRLYRYRQGQLKQITRDHSEAERLIDEGYPPEEIKGYEYSEAITRAVGADDDLELDVQVFEHQRKDRYLLCSDGLTKELSFADILNSFIKGSPKQAANKLLNNALSREGKDNTTIVVIDCI